MKKITEGTTKKLRDLKAGPTKGKKNKFDEATGIEVLKAYHRGVSLADIAGLLEILPNNIYSALGSWTLKFCKCVKHD